MRGVVVPINPGSVDPSSSRVSRPSIMMQMMHYRYYLPFCSLSVNFHSSVLFSLPSYRFDPIHHLQRCCEPFLFFLRS